MTPKRLAALRHQATEAHAMDRDAINEALDEVENLRTALGDAVNFMKDAIHVSIKSRGLQLEAEFFGDDQ